MDGRVKEQPISVKEIPTTCEEITKKSSDSSKPNECCDVTKSPQPDNKYTEQKVTENSVLPSHTLYSYPHPPTDADDFTVCLDKIEEKFNEFTQNLIKTFECDNTLLQCYGSSFDTEEGVPKSSKNLETIVEEPNKETAGEANANKINNEQLSDNSELDNDLKSADYPRSSDCLINGLKESAPVSSDIDKKRVDEIEKVSNDCTADSSNKEELTVGCCEDELKATSSEDVQCVNEPRPFTGCESPSLTSRTEKYQTESLDVNVDSSSVCSISDYCQEDLCTQYSDSESVKDIEFGDIYCHKTEGIPNSPSIKDELLEACRKELDVSDYENADSGCEDNDSNSTLRNLADKFVKTNGNLVQENSLVKELTESDISVYESFYSLDNSCTATPVIGRIKKTLTWTPRILSEERFLNSRSTTLSSKASFYTAETSGTFYSTRSFQLDSCDNFVTCEDFQKLKDLNGEQKSKLSKAKDALVRGKDFVKSKFDCYRRRLPGLGAVSVGNNSEGKKSRNLCHNTCGFSCVSQVGKEISQYSLPDLQSDLKSNSQAVCSLDENVNQLPQDEVDSVIDGSAKVDMAVTMRDKGNKEDDGDPDKDGVNFDGKRENEKKADMADEGERCGTSLPSGQFKTKQESKADTDTISRETTEDGEDDLPVGTEAGTMTQKMKDSEITDDSTKKRLRWVSAIEKTSTSMNSRAVPRLTACVEQLLYQREMDPEMLLNNLGFGGTFLGDDSLSRIPERFIPPQNMSPVSNQYQMPANYPEFQQMLPVMGTSQLMHGANSALQEPVFENSDEDEMDGNAGDQIEGYQSRKGSMQRPTFSALAQGVKFIHGAQVPEAPPSPDEETKRICAIPSILDFPNRRALARQGFYGDNYLKDLKSHRVNGPIKRSMSAAEKRKQFVHCAKSKGNWSLTDETEEDNPADNSRDSWDQGLRLKSFSDRFSSDSSLESSDSFSNEEQQLVKNKSIKDLRKQYEDAIRNSMDGECPVFTEQVEDTSEKKRKKSIAELRKNQVNQLMTSVDDDGDYVVRTDKTGSSRFGLDPKSILMQAQKSTQSTLTGSPSTPKDLQFSFDQTINDGESEFNFTESDKSDKLLKSGTHSVSIIIEEDTSLLESTTSGEVIQKFQNAADLNTLSLGLRSDSCNTLVPVDHLYDSENTEGELTPRSGNISPGIIRHYSNSPINSTEKSVSLDQSDFNKENVHPNVRMNGDVLRSRSLEDKNSLKPLQHSTQESFELEEVSSGEAVYEDFHIHTNKPLLQKGPLEKSVSIHSDSSGFADLDPAGEDSHSVQEQRSFVSKQLPNVVEQLPKKELYVCKRNVSCNSEDDESSNPSLSAISYSKTEQVMDKSLVFTVNVPIETTISDTESSVSRTSSKSRFVSQICLNVEAASKDTSYELNKDKSVSKITRVGDVTYMKVDPTGDLDNDFANDLDIETGHSEKNINLGKPDNVGSQRSGKGHLVSHDVNVPPTSMKNKIQQKIRVKENLVAASNNTADWLLESNKNFAKGHSTYNVGRPVWASTPNLKYKKTLSTENSAGNRIKREGNHSFDLLLDEEPGSSYENSSNRQGQTQNQHSLDQFDSRQHFLECRDQSEYSSIDEGLDEQSLIGSSLGVPDDHLNYLRLARLVNGPSLMMDVSKMPNSKFTPNFHMKNWMQLPKRKHIEEETFLMQHAVQRYKTELCLMENMLFTLYRTAHPDLTPEERSEVEELQHLWCEVRKEVIKMEELLAERLRSVMTGNDSYSPLDALEIVQQMIDLLREQLYHQQMCIGRDISFTEEDDDHEHVDSSAPPSSASSTVSETWMSDISSQMSDIKSSISASELSQKKELETRISELKKGLLSDVKQELSDTQNTEMLKLQLQARESEVRRLRMELLLQNVSLGKTRKKQVFESDV